MLSVPPLHCFRADQVAAWAGLGAEKRHYAGRKRLAHATPPHAQGRPPFLAASQIDDLNDSNLPSGGESAAANAWGGSWWRNLCTADSDADISEPAAAQRPSPG